MTPNPITRARALEIIEQKLPELARLQVRHRPAEWLDASGHKAVSVRCDYALLPKREDVLECWAVYSFAGECIDAFDDEQSAKICAASHPGRTVVHMREDKPKVVTHEMAVNFWQEYNRTNGNFAAALTRIGLPAEAQP